MTADSPEITLIEYDTISELVPFDEVLAIGRAYRSRYNIKMWGLAAFVHAPDRGRYVFTRLIDTGELTGRLAFPGEATSC